MKIEAAKQSVEGTTNVIQQREHVKPVVQHENVSEEKVTDEKVEQALKEVNNNADISGNGMKFEKDENSEQWFVKVFNEKTGEVIRQIPDKEFLEMARKIEKNMGSIFNKEV